MREDRRPGARRRRIVATLTALAFGASCLAIAPAERAAAASVQISPIRASGFVHAGDYGEPRVDITVCASFDQPVRFIEALVEISGTFGIAIDGPSSGTTTRWCGTAHDLSAGAPGSHTITVDWRAHNGNGLSQGYAQGSGSYVVPGVPPTPKKTAEQAADLAHASNAMWKAAAIIAVAGVIIGLAAASVATGGLATPLLVGAAISLLGGGAASYMAAELSDLSIDPPDPAYTVTVVNNDIPLTAVAAGNGIGAGAAAALNAWIAHLSRELGLGQAMVAALYKAEGAAQANDAGWEQTQTLAAANFAHLLSVDLQAEASLRASARAALEAEGFANITVTAAQAQTAVNAWDTTGLTAAQIDALTAGSARVGLDDRVHALARSVIGSPFTQTTFFDLLAPPAGSSTPNAIEQANAEAATALQTWANALTANPVGPALAGPAIITGVDPAQGPPAGGTSVTITGLNLSATTQINFGTKSVTGGTCSDTQCVVFAPSGSGVVPVSVTSPGGTSEASAEARFAYVSGVIGPVHLSATDLVHAGGFDPPDAKVVSSYESLTGSTGSVALGGWTISAGNVDLVGPGSAQAAEGLQFVDLNGNGSQGPGTITQQLTVIPGHIYRLSFRLAGNPNGQPTVKTLLASLGSTRQEFSFNITGHTNLALGWTEETLDSLNCDGQLTVSLASTTPDDRGPNIDAVSVVDLGLAPAGSCQAQLVSSRYQPLVPARLLETRTGAGLSTIDGQANGIGVRDAGSVTELQVGGRGGVAADAAAVVLNVTAADARSPGFITAYPCGADRPNAANVTYAAGQTAPNSVVSRVGTGGKVCLFTYGSTDLVVDVNGYFPAGNPYTSLVPARVLETRYGPGLGTIDDKFDGIGSLYAGSITKLHVAGRAGIVPDAAAVVLNVTAIDAQSPGFITAYPCGSNRPNAANLTYDTGQTVPNAIIVQVGTNGDVCLFSYGETDLAVDVNGYFPPATSFIPLVPARLLESRSGPGLGTIDGQAYGIGVRDAGSVTVLHVAGRGGVAADASAVVLNVTAVDPRSAGFITAFPCGSDQPNAASLTYVAGTSAPNAVVAQVGTNGDVCLFTYGAIDLVVDVDGYMI